MTPICALRGGGEVKIYNVLGEVVFQSKIINQKSEIDISRQPGGIYFVQVNDGEKTYSGKLIKE